MFHFKPIKPFTVLGAINFIFKRFAKSYFMQLVIGISPPGVQFISLGLPSICTSGGNRKVVTFKRVLLPPVFSSLRYGGLEGDTDQQDGPKRGLKKRAKEAVEKNAGEIDKQPAPALIQTKSDKLRQSDFFMSPMESTR